MPLLFIPWIKGAYFDQPLLDSVEVLLELNSQLKDAPQEPPIP